MWMGKNQQRNIERNGTNCAGSGLFSRIGGNGSDFFIAVFLLKCKSSLTASDFPKNYGVDNSGMCVLR